MGTLCVCAQLLLQFYDDSFETSQVFWSWSKDMHVNRYWVPCVCVRNSSYSFMMILLKLHRCFGHGLKICMWFRYNPQIIFVTFSAGLT